MERIIEGRCIQVGFVLQIRLGLALKTLDGPEEDFPYGK